MGFYVNWDNNSFIALKRALPHLDWIFPGWFSLQGQSLELKTDIDQRALDYIRATKPGVAILPMIQNVFDGHWDGPGLARLLADPAARADRLNKIIAVLENNKFQGLTVDFENVPPDAHKDLQIFLSELSSAFSAHGLAIVLAVPFDDDAWPYATYASIADFLLIMGYDEHWEEGGAGSLAGQNWFEDILDKRMQTLDPDRTIVALGGYGRDWIQGQSAEDITFEDAFLSAKTHHAKVAFDPESKNPHFSFIADNGKRHDVWFLDGVTAFNQIHAADIYRPVGYALWRLGAEDPSVWSVFGRPYGAAAPDTLHTIPTSEDIDFGGEGEILRIAATPSEGARTIDIDSETGQIFDQTYTRAPTPFVVQRTGAQPGKLALTFDDGPDPEWTPKILDILKDKGIHASFFIIGENAQSYPSLLRRILAEGHDVGNHTFTHPNLGMMPDGLISLEINATQRLFEALTGRSMRLFRGPYSGDAEPTTGDELVPIEIAQSMGYISVGLHVDPSDWRRPTVDEIVDRVITQVSDPDPDIGGHVILLHDAGGDRSSTVAALPRLIDTLRAKGYEFVPVSELAGMSRDQAMPPVPEESLGRMVGVPVFTSLRLTGELLGVLFFAAITLGILRLVFLCGISLRNRQIEASSRPPSLPENPPLASVLIPALNEAKVIVPAVQQLLMSDYPNLQVIVIDDGSEDGTADLIRVHFATDPRVTLVAKTNGGKAAALNAGLARARGSVIVALDADTHFPSDSISKLVRWFQDPAVAAVAGNAKVGNRVNTITRWQALEYVTSQNLERRALATLGCITVVPGAIGAWRREAIEELGGFPVDTLAEDQDLTIALLKAGHKVLYDSTAIGWTEAPDTIRGLLRQRFRWTYGTLQCLWKHRHATLQPRYKSLGLIAVPQTWLFLFLFSMVAPLVDVALIWRLGASAIDYFHHHDQFDGDTLSRVFLYYLVFLVVDLGSAVLALGMEGKESWSLVPSLVLQRLGYRQLMYYTVINAVGAAAFGHLVGWGKVERKSTIALAPGESKLSHAGRGQPLDHVVLDCPPADLSLGGMVSISPPASSFMAQSGQDVPATL